MGLVERLWAAGEMPFRDGLYRSDDTGVEVHVDGPGAYHPDAGQPIPFRLGEPLDVAEAIEEDGVTEAYPAFESPLPDGAGRVSGGGSGMGNIGYLARLDADRSFRWVLVMFHSNPFVGVRHEGATAVFTNDWGNRLALDLTRPALARGVVPKGSSRPRDPRRDP
ncbi:hypothetical protein OG302_05345 [Streptomyces sp. NBC_01283]|uniref:hypothetical protein n=1 Tax=Streptomyces sp. NBC_01283 TaxID=2903812 RepID=UPI00352EA3D2|nr:hypothetical protein OG302_05345 [Streptomyces sp. NBC_01283]